MFYCSGISQPQVPLWKLEGTLPASPPLGISNIPLSSVNRLVEPHPQSSFDEFDLSRPQPQSRSSSLSHPLLPLPLLHRQSNTKIHKQFIFSTPLYHNIWSRKGIGACLILYYKKYGGFLSFFLFQYYFFNISKSIIFPFFRKHSQKL